MAVDFTGCWKADLSQSKLSGPTPKRMIINLAHADPDLRQEIVVTKADDSEERISFCCRTNGEPGHCRLNQKEVRGTAHWQGEELVIELWIQQGEKMFYLRDCWSLSPDGQTLTMQHRNDALAGQVTVLHRISGE